MNLKIGHRLDASTWSLDDAQKQGLETGHHLRQNTNSGQRGSLLPDSRITSRSHQSDRSEQTR